MRRAPRDRPDDGGLVVCADVEAAKFARLNTGEIPIYESGVEPLVERNMAERRLRFTTGVSCAVAEVEITGSVMELR